MNHDCFCSFVRPSLSRRVKRSPSLFEIPPFQVCLIRTPKFEVVYGFIPSLTLIR
ncbi:hypothetical protein DEO72_LG10g2042 [Vigna unguiculata]|uniref:Uncharacterized protein n=1 Tax=Vigna unguiculata TaxID=3917 RepID=A0A4D6NA98_VIGUN|nr:hypothetical protein DEO72_LG10g2042 [Vigna unguiculata]